MSPTVFISHSCKDNERHPPPSLTNEQIRARRARLDFARMVRDRLEQRLTDGRRAGEREFEVFLDVDGGLSAGDIWRDELHKALRTCDGGVILLTPDSIESGWVLKEATILSWRVFEDKSVIVVPIVVDLQKADLDRNGFGPLDLDQIQWVEIANESELTEKIEEVVAALGRIPERLRESNTTLSRTDRWITGFAERLARAAQGRLSTDSLHRMFEAIDIAPDERDQFDSDPFVVLARQAILATGPQIVMMLNKAGDPDRMQREELRNAASMMWVDAAPASHLLLAARCGRVIAIDSTESRTLREYVLRACCNDIDSDRIVEPPQVTSGTHDDAITAITSTLAELYPLEDPVALSNDVRQNGPIFVLLGPGLVRPSVLAEMTTSYPQLTYLAATGPEPHKTLGAWTNNVVMLQPILQPNREKEATRFRNRLKLFVDGKAAQ